MIKQGILQLQYKPVCRFNNFALCENNLLAFQAIKALVLPPHKYTLCYLYGDSGCGKTHLAKAFVEEYKKMNEGVSILWIECRRKNDNDEAEEFINIDPTNYHALIIENVDSLNLNHLLYPIVWNYFNVMHQRNAPIIITANVKQHSLNNLDDQLISRFSWGVTAIIGQIDHNTRRNILTKIAKDMGINISESVANYILNRLNRRTDAMINYLKIVDMISLENKCPVTIHLLKSIHQHNWQN